MSSKPETTFILSVHKHLPHELHREKMFNPYRGGTADCWYSGRKGDLWVEYKFLPKLPSRDDTEILPSLDTLQLDWLRRRHYEGRRVWVIVGCPLGGVILVARAWEYAMTTRRFKQSIKDRKALASEILAVTEPKAHELSTNLHDRQSPTGAPSHS